MTTRQSVNLAHQLAALGAATVHEAIGKIGALPSSLKPVDSSWVLAGPAFTLVTPPNNNIFIHDAIYAAPPGSVLVIDTCGAAESGYWGEIMSHAAQIRGLAGMVINGGVRDSRLLVEIGFPVFSRGLCIRGTDKDRDPIGRLGEPVALGGVTIAPGDFIVGDRDGIVSIPASMAQRAADEGRLRESAELDIIERLRRGETTLEIYGF